MFLHHVLGVFLPTSLRRTALDSLDVFFTLPTRIFFLALDRDSSRPVYKLMNAGDSHLNCRTMQVVEIKLELFCIVFNVACSLLAFGLTVVGYLEPVCSLVFQPIHAA